MKIKTAFVCAIASVGLAVTAVPAYAGTPGFCPQVASQPYSFYWWLSAHLPTVALEHLFGSGGTCSR